MINGQLDETDVKILRLLEEDSRMDLKPLSELVHKRLSTVSRRIVALSEAGYIRKSVAVVNRKLIGRPVLVVAMVLLEKQSKSLLKEFELAAIRHAGSAKRNAYFRQMGFRAAGHRRNAAALL